MHHTVFMRTVVMYILLNREKMIPDEEFSYKQVLQGLTDYS